jgi:type VI secretion system protein ImpE
MKAKEFLDAGDLAAAIAQVGAELKAAPTDGPKRTLLFELLCCAGDLDRAVKQLDVIGAESSDRDLAVQPYRNVLEGERKRRRLFSEGLVPGLPKRVPDYTRLHLEAVNRIREGHYADARALLEEAEAARPPAAGTIDGEPFDDLKDADDLLGPFLEVITATNYSWIPWEAVRSVSMEAPRHLRDLVWLPARVELDIGSLGEVFLPVLYVNSYQHHDNRVKLGRMTDWQADTEGLSLASGQKLLMVGERDWPLLEIRQLAFEPSGGSDGDTSTNS